MYNINVLRTLLLLYLRMHLKEFLAKNKIIKQAELARLMFDNKPSSNTRLANKLSGVNYQRLTEEDQKLAIEVLKLLATDIASIEVSE